MRSLSVSPWTAAWILGETRSQERVRALRKRHIRRRHPNRDREARPAPPGVVLVADAMAGRPGGRLAGAEQPVRSRLLGRQRVAAVGQPADRARGRCGLCPRGQISLSDWIHLVIRIAQRVPLLPFVWPFEPLAPGLPFLGASSILADTTICLGISASGKLAGSVPGAHRRKTILNPVVGDPSICTV